MSEPLLPLVKPGLRDLMDAAVQEAKTSLNCVQVGEIVSYDHAKNTASVKIMSLRKYLDEATPREYPVLGDCPVFIMSGGNSALTMPVVAGDPCLILFADRDIDNWYATGDAMVPNTPRLHSISDAMVLVGVRPSTDPVVTTGGIVHGKTDVEWLMESLVAVRLLAGPGMAEVKANGTTGKISIKNQVQSLFTIVNALVDQIAAMTYSYMAGPGVPPGTPTITAPANNAAAITAIKTQLALLMEA